LISSLEFLKILLYTLSANNRNLGCKYDTKFWKCIIMSVASLALFLICFIICLSAKTIFFLSFFFSFCLSTFLSSVHLWLATFRSTFSAFGFEKTTSDSTKKVCISWCTFLIYVSRKTFILSEKSSIKLFACEIYLPNAKLLVQIIVVISKWVAYTTNTLF
jgi:hypothetical protein